jgi:hypothetical protein
MVPAKAELPLLETLTLSGGIPHQVLSLIRTPALRKMEIEANISEEHSLVTANLTHLVPSLERLYLSFNKGKDVTTWVEELEQLVKAAPSLVSVRVRPWMVQHLKGKEWHAVLHVTDS